MTVLFVVANLPDFSLGFILLVILYSGKGSYTEGSCYLDGSRTNKCLLQLFREEDNNRETFYENSLL